MYFGVFVHEEFFERLPKEAAACRCVARLQGSIPWGDRRVGCPAQSHLPAKGEAAQGKQVGSEKCVCVCVWRQEQVLDSHRRQEGQWAKVKPEEEENPGDKSQGTHDVCR